MKNVQNTHNLTKFDPLHDALLAIVGAFNRPQRDELMIQKSAILLERALFPLLVQISRYGPIGVVELADRAGRDYTTVSRQLAKLEEAGLAQRQKNAQDRRINEAVITAAGRAMTDRVDAVRSEIYEGVFQHWPEEERETLVRLLQKFVADFSGLEERNSNG